MRKGTLLAHYIKVGPLLYKW